LDINFWGFFMTKYDERFKLSVVRPKKYRSFKGELGQAAPNKLQRQFATEAANRKWVTDATR
jgi:transposase InsO family protein